MSQIRNQAECGSCWAFGAVETLTDRYCIASNQTENPVLATEYLISCDEYDNGCEGGVSLTTVLCCFSVDRILVKKSSHAIGFKFFTWRRTSRQPGCS